MARIEAISETEQVEAISVMAQIEAIPIMAHIEAISEVWLISYRHIRDMAHII